MLIVPDSSLITAHAFQNLLHLALVLELDEHVRRVLRVSGSGMKSHCASAPVSPEPLQPVRHDEKIERMNGEQLALLDRVLPQLEAGQAP
jgi:hypothetical protein